MSKRGPYFVCHVCGYKHLTLEKVNEHIIDRHPDKIRVWKDENDWGGWIKDDVLRLADIDQLIDSVKGSKPDLLLMSQRSRRKILVLSKGVEK